MPTRSTLLGAALGALLLLPAAAQAHVTDVSVAPDGAVVVGTPATFTATAFDGFSAPSGSTTYYFALDCTDNTAPAQYEAGTASNVYTHTFDAPGTHHLCAAAFNGNLVTTTSSDFQVTEVDPGPTAALTVSPLTAVPGQTVTFDASASKSAVPGGLDYTFDVDGDPSNGFEVDNGANPVLTHVYAANFNQTVGVRVIDRNRLAASATAQLLVSTPPVLGPQGVPVDANGNVALPPSISDGPLGAVKFTVDKTTIQQFLTSGMHVNFQWGAVNAKAAVSYYLVTSKKVKGKTKKTKLLIAAPSDNVFYSPGSNFTREAKGKAAIALRKLKKATIELDWTVTSKKGDKKTGTVTVVLAHGL